MSRHIKKSGMVSLGRRVTRAEIITVKELAIGDIIEGEFVKFAKVKKFGEPLLVLKDADGNDFMLCASAGISKGLLDAEVKRGEFVQLVYNGKRAIKGGKSYHDFTIFVKDDGNQADNDEADSADESEPEVETEAA